MGGNNSRLINPNSGDALPAKIRPLLGQRIEEFRKRRNNVQGEDTDLSKKELLKDSNGSFDEKSSDKNEVSEETQSQKEQPTVIRAVAVEKLSQVVPLPVSECGNVEEKKEKEKEERNGQIETAEVTIQENIYEKRNAKHDEEEEEDDEEEEEEDDIGRRIGPGSPSFKIYCVESDEKKEQELNDTNAGREQILEKEDENIVVHNKSQSTDSDGSETSESENASNSNEVSKCFQFI